MSIRPDQAADGQNDETPAYLTESYTTEDGLEIPPPTRPMGPRRLSRYYEEVAEYLRALQRGDEELPEVPMFMGAIEGVEVEQDAARSLVDLSQMGSISTGEGEKLDVDFDNTRATVVEDPLAHIDQQVLGADYSEQAEATEQVDFAAAAGEITGESDFVSVDELQAEEAQAKDEEYRATHPEEEAQAELAEDTQSGPVTELFTVSQHTPNLPTPVRAVDAQGLDLTEIDSADVTDPAASTLASDSTGAVDSDSSEETAESAPETPAAAPGPDQEEDAQRFNFAGTVKQTDEAPSGDLAEVEQEAAATYSPETSEGRSTGAIVAVVGLLLLVLVLATVWFLFFS
ncbi:MAG TPA: hypothetical protein H9908_08515 [Candidatus Rothia avistercoris]|uniref:Uncharacterized protein n=1 Tax=Candidatus Rothia avistercoris TaxID=2840479 RepID=A0A9D2ZT43_9MICC|nr:hypothetical protein [Candidatus Rothia avistercoris]